MEIIIVLLAIIGLLFLGAAIYLLFFKQEERRDESEVSIPENTSVLSDEDKVRLKFYLKEWQVIIETQMHFNDLILRFRSITLTSFITLIGAVVAIGKLGIIKSDIISSLFTMIFFLWLTSFIIDFFYYNQLLIGSINAANKYDNSKFNSSLGLFGMTNKISHQVRPFRSKWLIGIYYFLPAIGMVITFLMLK